MAPIAQLITQFNTRFLSSEREWWLLHLHNVLGSATLFVIFWFWAPEWVRVPYAAFWGAANYNSLLAWLVRRDMQKYPEGE